MFWMCDVVQVVNLLHIKRYVGLQGAAGHGLCAHSWSWPELFSTRDFPLPKWQFSYNLLEQNKFEIFS